jgi:RND family efflux transporter MFP subunit
MSFRKNKSYRQLRFVAASLLWMVFLIFWSACEEKATRTPPPPPKVTVVQPARKSVTDYLEVTGNTQAFQKVQLVARVAGYLEKVLFQDGQMVKKGQTLFLIQQDTYQYALHQAEGQISLQKAQIEYAEKQLARYSHLLEPKAASQMDVDNWRFQRDSAQANLKAAEAARDIAKLNLIYTEVRAPFDGRIDRRLVDPGDLVGSGGNTVLTELNQIDPIYIYFTISDLDLTRLMKSTKGIPRQAEAEKRPVFVGLPSEEGYPHQGELDFIATSLNTTTGTLLLRGVLPNPEGKILPGLFARVRVPLEMERQALVVPQEAVDRDQLGAHVLTVDEKNLVRRIPVKPGAVGDQSQVIDEGLTGSEWVIVKGHLRAIVGRQVTPERGAFAQGRSGS